MSNSWSSKHRVAVEAELSGGKTISIESGWIAKQADGSVIVRSGETMVLCTVCSAPPRPGMDFFPLTVEYQERAYAAGKIPGGFFRREGKPAETEILACRIIDRPIRPLFPDGYMDDVQVVCTVISADGQNSPDTLAITGAGAALSISSLPFSGPVAGVRVGRVGGKFIVNPTRDELATSDIDLVVAATKDAIVMVEGGAEFVPEAELLEALFFGHDECRKLCDLQDQLKAKVGKEKQAVVVPERDSAIRKAVEELAHAKLVTALGIKAKHQRSDAVSEVSKATIEALSEKFAEKLGEVKTVLHDLQYEIVRKRAIKEKTRLDGRGLTDVRPIECQTGLIPRAHGSALFTRGETQAIVTATLGTGMDAQRTDAISAEGVEKTFMLHYNFPPYSTGESKPMRGTGRREIGHGALAERSVKRILPEKNPYVIRIVSDITESNGSSSMASVCGASLALMDAGIAVKYAVAGVAMGLVQEPEGVAILTDILGDEDHLGDMDFKVAGNTVGISGIQMDIKCLGLSRETMTLALEQARVGRLHILGEMEKAMSTSKAEMSKYAPRMHTLKINPDKIRDVIGPGGKMIRSITESTGVKIDIQDDGTVTIASSSESATQKAMDIIKGLTEEAEIGRIYNGVVKRIADFGAFVEILPGLEGLVHISQLDHDRVNVVSDVCAEGDEMKVRVIDIDKQGRIRLSRKEAMDS